MVNTAVLERLNYAIAAASRAAEYQGPAGELERDWAAWWDASAARSLGLIGVPFIVGAASAFFDRYRAVYMEMVERDPMLELPAPDEVEPTATLLTTEAAQLALEQNADAAERAYEAASSGGRVLLETASEGASRIASEAARGRLVVLGVAAAVAVIWAIGQLRR